MRQAGSAVFLVAAVLAFVAPREAIAVEQDRSGARSAAEEGAKAFEEGRYDDAVRFLKKAESLVHAPPHLLFLARAYQAQGHLVQAQESYMAIVSEKLSASAPDAFHDAQKEANVELEAIQARIPKLTISVAEEYADLVVTVDDKPVSSTLVDVPTPIDPGEHVVVVSARGKVRAEQRITLKEGARESLSFALEDAAGPAPTAAATATTPGADATPAYENDSRSTWGYALLGGGIVFVGVGSYFGLAAKSQKDDALGDDDLCGGPGCTERGREEIDAAITKSRIATGGFALGAAALGVGTYLLLTGKPPSSETARWTPILSPNTLGLTYGGTL